MLAALLYLGAGAGMAICGLFMRRGQRERFEKGDLPFILLMIVLDIAAPILLMLGLSRTDAASASLLNNFEIVATALIALCLFSERVSARLWIAITLITLASCLLSVEDIATMRFGVGALFVLLACVCWGLENNCTRRLSGRDPLRIVVVKGVFSGLGSLIVALIAGEAFPPLSYAACALLLGFVAYGLSIFFYVRAQKTLGAARTSAYYAIAPFVGTALSFLFFPALPQWTFFAALLLMLLGAFLVLRDGLAAEGAQT